MQKLIVFLLLLLNIAYNESLANLEVGILNKNDSTCVAKIKGYSSVNSSGNIVNIQFLSKTQPIIFNNCQFLIIDQNKKIVTIKGGKVTSVLGCDIAGKRCDISFKNESTKTVSYVKPKNTSQDLTIAEYKVTQKIITKKKGDILIAIDAGHGGQDPGAIGKNGLKEKDVTLRYATHIANILKKGGYKVFLTRTHDESLKLYERIDIAMIQNADFFISIHADSAPNKQARGATIYTLSPQSINSATMAAENRLNISGNFIEADDVNKDEDLIFNILNLQHSSNLRQSFEFAEALVAKMKSKGIRFTSIPVRPANFAVLKAPIFPAILLEIGYISNLEDEKLMQSKEYMENVATSIKMTLDNFLKNE